MESRESAVRVSSIVRVHDSHGPQAKKGTRILSAAAIATILQAQGPKAPVDDETNLRPPYMHPCAEPLKYSKVGVVIVFQAGSDALPKWCSICNDFGEILVLCAGCRVGVCVAGRGTSGGCFEYNPRIQSQDFVFYCPYCATARKKACQVRVGTATTTWQSHLNCSQLVTRQGVVLPSKGAVWFRYDPPTLIVAITWHLTQAKFGRLLHDRLALSYFNNAKSVSRYFLAA